MLRKPGTEAQARPPFDDGASESERNCGDAVGCLHGRCRVEVVRANDTRDLRVEAVATRRAHQSLKDYGHLLGRDPGYSFRTKKLAPLVRDATEVAAELGYTGRAPQPLRVAYHAACTMQHGQRLTGLSESLLEGAGFRISWS